MTPDERPHTFRAGLYQQTHCYACGVTVVPHLSEAARMSKQFARYEQVVERIENHHATRSFSIMDLWREVGATPVMLTPVRYVVRDMARHGLIRCVHQTKDGRCCLQWELVR